MKHFTFIIPLLMIYLIPIGDIDVNILNELTQTLSERFGFECRIGERMKHPDYAYNSNRKQYHSTAILRKITVPDSAVKVLGIVDLDLYVPSLNFVFGEAEIDGKKAIISIKRLRQEFYNLPKDDELFKQRVIKEAVHELGHTFGLTHCKDVKCVMHFSNSLQDTDIKSDDFCSRCKSLLH